MRGVWNSEMANGKVEQKVAKDTARQSRNHKQEDQSQPHGISCTQRTLRNAEDTEL